MVTKKCENVRSETFSKSDIENMTDEIYYALEEKQEKRININLTNNMSSTKAQNSSAVSTSAK